jgi:nucleoside-diphosphate-sugar epimerase
LKRALVTGATGFIGRHAPALLEARGYEVRGVGSEVNLLDPAQAEGLVREVRPSHLLHFAWYAEPGKFWSAPENADWVEASISLLRAFSAAGGERAVVSGSCAEYDWSGGGVLSERETPLQPATYYGVCKDALRAVAEGLASVHGFGLAWGRIFFTYGPHEPRGRLVSEVARALVRGEPARTTDGAQRRDFLHARDVAAAFVALLDSDLHGAVNIGSGEAVAVRDVVDAISAAAGRPDLVQFGAFERRPDDPPLLQADDTRLRDELRWRPSTPLADGIRETVEWWKANVE